ncbi:MAG: PQQ-binding-like beta-propeller repeat protein, partial [Planctomycetota bacterium]|nr:PQQ-binding-like beta-propeller repeat protein [Planctomycetota bacterium]
MTTNRVVAVLLFGLLAIGRVSASDWPQLMRSADRTGDAADESLKLPLGLEAQIELDDAVTTSPAVVDGRAYVVDQMGTAYCVDLEAGTIRWKVSPGGTAAFGSNTSSPCVARGRVCYGTTAGRFHVLEAETGRVIKNLDVEASITASPTNAGDRVYFQSTNAVVYCVNLDGEVLWTWDHYVRHQPPLEDRLKRYHPGSYDRPHYGGGEIAVSDGRLVTGIGWDHLCLEDKGDRAELKWCNRAALGKDDGIPMACSISDGSVYTAWPGVDGAGSLLRVSLADGSFNRKQDQLHNLWAITAAPAARGSLVVFGRHVRGVTAMEFGKQTLWSSYHWSDVADYTPTFASPVLTKDHCLFTTLKSELIAVPLDARGDRLSRLKPAAYRFQTPNQKMIATTPVVSDGRVVFGCDDGFLYVLSSDGRGEPRSKRTDLHKRRSKLEPATGKSYDWSTPDGGPSNTRFVNDSKLKPPFKLLWAVRSFGLFHQPVSAAGEDIVFVSMAGTVACLEQQTGRIRWRMRLPRQSTQFQGVLCADGRIYIARPLQARQPYTSGLWCIDQETGETLWRNDIGTGTSGVSKGPP